MTQRLPGSYSRSSHAKASKYSISSKFNSMKFLKLTPLKREQVTEAVLKLRFGPSYDKRKKQVYLSYASIAKALEIPYATVQHICRYKPVA